MIEYGNGADDAQEWLPVPYDHAGTDLDPDIHDEDFGQDFADAQLPILRDYEGDDDLIPPYANYPIPQPEQQPPLPRPTQDLPAVRPRKDLPAPLPKELVRRSGEIEQQVKYGTLSITTDSTEKHVRHYKIKAGPDGQVDANRLLVGYFESLREGKTYPHETKINPLEDGIIKHYSAAQLRLARHLRIPESVEYKIAHTPYHIFTHKKHADTAVAEQMGSRWVTAASGMYTPVTGVVWVRTSNRLSAEAGLARMVVESSAAALTLPADSSPQKAIASAPNNARRKREEDDGFEVMLGHGYDRVDILPRPDCTGVHKAVGDMAALRIMRGSGYRGPAVLSALGINVILDGVIRETAARQREDVRVVADDLLKGYYNGHLGGLNRITDALGRAGAYSFLTLNGREKRQDITRIANELKIPAIAETYGYLAEGGKGGLYRW